jgi:hypothetical protein
MSPFTYVVITRLDRVTQATCENSKLRLGSPGPSCGRPEDDGLKWT